MVELHTLIKKRESDEEFLVGRADTGVYMILPSFALKILDLLDSGVNIKQASILAEKEMGEPVDVLDFVQQIMQEYEFVHKVDGKVVSEKQEERGQFSWIPSKWGQIAFHPISNMFYVLLFIIGIVICVMNPGYFPSFNDIIPSTSLSISFVSIVIIGWMLLFIHEFAHLLAALSLNVQSKIGVGHRLVFPVAETDISNIVTVPRKQRYKVFLAGMLWDGAMFGIGIVVLLMHHSGMMPLHESLIPFVRFFNLSQLLSIAFQFMFFMETDIYYVFSNFFKCNNLLQNTRLTLRNKIKRLEPSQLEVLQHIAPREKKIITWYIWFYMMGCGIAISLFFMFTLPQSLRVISMTFEKMNQNTIYSAAFLDGVLFICIILIPFAVLLYSWITTWNTNRKFKMKNFQP